MYIKASKTSVLRNKEKGSATIQNSYKKRKKEQMMQEMILCNNVKIPIIGFGVFQTKEGKETKEAVKWALEGGYRHIDTAKIYGNEASVGEAIKESGVRREDIFLTSKIWNQDIRDQRTRAAFEESLERLDTDYLDLCLIHWPAEGYPEAWTALEELYHEGKIKAIGVSNFHIHHFDTLAETMTILPMVNQIESNPRFNNQPLIDYCQAKGIVVESYSPLGGTGTNMIADPTLKGIADKYKKSVVHVILRWNIQRNIVALPKSVHKKYIQSNIDCFDFALTDEEMLQINAMNTNTRSGGDPDNFSF